MKDLASPDALEHRTRILQKAEELVHLIQSTETFVRFQQAEDKINRHPDAQALLFVAKAKRNAYSRTSLRFGYDHPTAVKAKQEYDEVLRQIAEIPLMEQYKAYQEELNELMQGITRTIINTLAPDVPAEIFEEKSGGCRSGGCGGCRNH
ncbi:YlbF family regulator [Effusibacillus pohliae]|uniref:YlbF family regulator n=1 Tax=Effusibacillus pohliae TaxID=232270 RepID=UPI00035E2C9A|nr:YlbF family regulator [Effusibacillus pohliae]